MNRSYYILALVCALIFAPKLIATPIPLDLSITASASFADDSLAGLDDFYHNATMSAIQGGLVSQATVNDTLVSGANPLGGLLSDINDGVAIESQAGGGALGIVGGYFFDFNFGLQNTSLTTAYLLSFVLQFDNLTSASGDDAFADSKILLFDADLNEFFFSDLTTDTLFGDQKNGDDPATFGVTQTDSGLFNFNIILNAGALSSFTGQLRLEGGEFSQAGDFAISSFASITLAGVRSLDTPPPQIPLPATGWLFVLGLFFVGQRQLRKQL